MGKREKLEIIDVPVRVNGIQAIVEECPLCGESHVYGAGSGKPLKVGDEIGLQLSSCTQQSPRPQFRLMVEEIEKQRPGIDQGC